MSWVHHIEPMDFTELARTFPYAGDMAACIQDEIHHAEGDVWTHLQMIHAQLIANGDDRISTRLATLFHDCAKPETRIVEWSDEHGRDVVRHPYHSRKGAQRAWFDMSLGGCSLEQRLLVYWSCLFHQRVFHLWKYPDMARKTLEISFSADGQIVTTDDLWRDLFAFARADQEGRICQNKDSDHIDLLRMWLDEAPTFANDASRLFYFEGEGRSPFTTVPQPSGSRATVMCGLPGAGKDTFIETNLHGLPIVSLDAIRTELGIKPTDNQGTVIALAYERAKEHLRKKMPFVWNATNVTRSMREKIIGLCRAYDAYVDVVAIDRPLVEILKQNKSREQSVPDSIIFKLARKYEPPTRLEAHEVLFIAL